MDRRTFLAASAGVSLLESRPTEGPGGDRLLSRGTEPANPGTVITAASAEDTKASTDEQPGDGGRKDAQENAAGGAGSQGGDGGRGGSGTGGPGGRAQPPLAAGDANVEPGKEGDGGATGHDRQAEDGKGLPSGQIVADNTPDKGGDVLPSGQIVGNTTPAGNIPAGKHG